MPPITIGESWTIFECCLEPASLTPREVALMKLAFASGVSAARVYPVSIDDRIPFLLSAGVEFGACPESPSLEPSQN
jgi:hypothetical protein